MSVVTMTERCLFAMTEAALLIASPVHKAEAAIALYRHWQSLDESGQSAALRAVQPGVQRELDTPGRPERPELVEPHQLARRGLGSRAGRIALLHSLAHIEFNAINLALDAVWRFRDMPIDYVSDWLRVASDEGRHYLLLHARLADFDANYGDLPAHDGLWDMARRTAHDVLVRMALVPRILEARGLDVAPPMMEKLTQQGDTDSAAILQTIYTDEITHVAVGNRWFRYLCEQRGLDGAAVFRDLLAGPASQYLRSPYNDAARLQAGFTREEIAIIRTMEQEYKDAQSAAMPR